MKKVLLSEPNISEGRDPQVVEQVFDQIRQVEGVKILDFSSDADHNRSVFTYLGEPEPVREATKGMAAKAIELIDMTQHQGSHPRMGAVDVVPFIPVRGIETGEAVEIARQFGKFVGGLGVPVYYYEDAATRPERESCPRFARGSTKHWKKNFKTRPGRPTKDRPPLIPNRERWSPVCALRWWLLM